MKIKNAKSLQLATGNKIFNTKPVSRELKSKTLLPNPHLHHIRIGIDNRKIHQRHLRRIYMVLTCESRQELYLEYIRACGHVFAEDHGFLFEILAVRFDSVIELAF